MKLKSGALRGLIALAMAALLIALFVFGPPAAVRYLALQYLQKNGVHASIGDVDASLLTGEIELRDAKGKTPEGDGFDIGRVALSIDYLPLLSQRISVSRLALDDARIDIHRSADGHLRVGGIGVWPRENSQTSNWGFALAQLQVGALRIHYSQPAIGDTPAVDRELVLKNTSARDVVSWQQDSDVPVDASIRLGDGRIGISGQIAPFGKKLTAQLRISSEELALETLAPIARAAGLTALAGTLESQQKIDIEYARRTGLSVAIDGKAGWQNARLALASGPGFTSDRLDWQGQLTIQLLGAGSDPFVDTDALNARMARGLRLAPPARKPQRGPAHTPGDGSTPVGTLTANPHLQLRLSDSTGLAVAPRAPPATSKPGRNDSIAIKGRIRADGFAAHQPDGFELAQKHGNWQGKLRIRLDDTQTRIEAHSTLESDALRAGLAGGSSLDADQLTWRGQTDLTLAPGSTRLATDGMLDARDTHLALAGSAALDSRKIEWRGETRLDTGDPLRHRASGRLQVRNADFTRVHSPLTIAATDASFEGSYKLTPGAPGAADILASDGRLYAQGLAVSDPGVLDLQQDKTDWHGKTTLTLDAARTQIATDGDLDTRGMRLALADSAAFESSQLGWQGQTSLTLGAQQSHRANGRLKARKPHITLAHAPLIVDASALAFNGNYRLTPGAAGTPDSLTSDGALHVDDLDVSQPGTFSLRQHTTDWHGKTVLTLGKTGTHLRSDSALTGRRTRLAVPDAAHFVASRSKWRGNVTIGMAGTEGPRASGRIDLDDARLDLDNTPLAFDASQLSLQGRYHQASSTPRIQADVDAQQLRVINTAIDGNWASARAAHATQLELDGLDRIKLGRLETEGLVVLQDATGTALMRAPRATARAFSLNDLQAWHFGALDITGAQFHLGRNDQGVGVLAQFFPKNKADENSTQPTRDDARNKTTFAIDSTRVNGASLDYADAAVTPTVRFTATDLALVLSNLNTARPDESAKYQLSADLDRYAHIDSFGEIAPLAPKGANMNLVAYLRSLSLAPLSGYLNAAMDREIARGVANGSLTLKATNGQLNGKLDVTLSNFRLANRRNKKTTIAYGISMSTALRLLRTRDDNFDFTTLVLGDLTYPRFSINNLVREAVLAGLRTALTSKYSPLGLLNRLTGAVVNAFTSLSFRAVTFRPGLFYVLPEDRPYLSHVVTAMKKNPELALTITGHAKSGEAPSISQFSRHRIHRSNLGVLESLALARAEAVRDYIAARGIKAERLRVAAPVVDQANDTSARATLSIQKPG